MGDVTFSAALLFSNFVDSLYFCWTPFLDYLLLEFPSQNIWRLSSGRVYMKHVLIIPPAFMPWGIQFSPFLSSIRMFVRPDGIYVKILCQSFSSGEYLTNYSSESIHIWTMGTLEGLLPCHEFWPQDSCPGVWLEVKIKSVFCFSVMETTYADS